MKTIDSNFEMIETVLANGTISERISCDHPPPGDDDGAIRRTTTVQLAILVAVAIYVYRKVCQRILDFREKMNRSEVVPGFPSNPNPHWLVGHMMVIRGAEVAVVKKKKGKGKTTTSVEDEDENSTQVSTSFVRGYQQVYCDHSDPKTGMGSFWFFHIPAVSLLGGRDARKVMCSSSYRKTVWVLNKHTRQFLGQKTLLTLMKKEWRYYRNAVHKSFTSETVKQSRPFIYQIGNTLADSLLAKIAQNELPNETEDESIGDDGSEDGTVPSSNPLLTPTEVDTTGPIPILPLMKMATIDVFGLVALRSNGVDFGCTRNLQLSPIASAFDHLTTEYTVRIKRPWDPFSFLYTLPTKANREYRLKRSRIRNFISEQITQTRARIAQTQNSNENDDAVKGQNDLLTNLITAADSEKAKAQQEEKVDDQAHDEALGDILMTLLFAGYDTTSISLTYALYLLAKNPTKKAKCLAEIDAVLGSDTDFGDANRKTIGRALPPGPDDFPYTKATVLEALRIFPPAPSTLRTMEKPTTIGGDGGGGGGRNSVGAGGNRARISARPSKINKTTTGSGKKNKIVTLGEGQIVMLPIWSIQRSELNYPRPLEMIPERWVRRKRKRRNACNDIYTSTETHSGKSKISLWEVRPEDDSHKEDSGNDCINSDVDDDDDASIPPANRDAFVAFAAGARNCVGKNLAVEKSVILLVCLLHKLSFELVSETYEVSPMLHSVVQQPGDDLPMIIRPRQ